MEKKKVSLRIPQSPVSEFLFSDTRMAWLWLIVRVYVGYEWLTAGIAKASNPAWVGGEGTAMKGFVTRAISKATGDHPDVQSWYAAFLENFVLPNAGWFSYLIVAGEILVGVALILGLFVAIAAFFGTFMNANFLLAGAISSNPILIFWQLLLILAWRTAGWYGLDRYILSYFGTPWAPGKAFSKNKGKYVV